MKSSKLFQAVLRCSRSDFRKSFAVATNSRVQGRHIATQQRTRSCLAYFSNGPFQVARNFHFTAARWAFDEVEQGEEFCISYDRLKEGIDNDRVQIIDVRRSDEVDAGRIPANRFIHIPVQEIAEALQLSDEDFKDQYGVDKPSKDASDIVFHCKLGGRSTFALRTAQNLGYTKARHYPGGWSEWNEKNP